MRHPGDTDEETFEQWKKRLRREAKPFPIKRCLAALATLGLVAMAAGALVGCAGSVGGGLNEEITAYRPDGTVESVSKTVVTAPKNFATLFAKLKDGISDFVYSAETRNEDGTVDKFEIKTNAHAKDVAGSTPEAFANAVVGIIGPGGIGGIVGSITDREPEKTIEE